LVYADHFIAFLFFSALPSPWSGSGASPSSPKHAPASTPKKSENEVADTGTGTGAPALGAVPDAALGAEEPNVEASASAPLAVSFERHSTVAPHLLLERGQALLQLTLDGHRLGAIPRLLHASTAKAVGVAASLLT
jgi:hypothetical protein